MLATLHRPSNVDLPDNLDRTLAVLEAVQAKRPVLFPVHPRTRERLQRLGRYARLVALPALKCRPPLGYLDFMSALEDCAAVVTDSGGIQEEASYLEIPCFTLRPNTERPLTLTHGTNRLLPFDPAAVVGMLDERRATRLPADLAFLWDGRAAVRVAERLEQVSR